MFQDEQRDVYRNDNYTNTGSSPNPELTHVKSELRSALAQTKLSSDGYSYVFLRFPLARSSEIKRWIWSEDIPVFCTMWDEEELSIMVKQDVWLAASHLFLDTASVSPTYKCITFDIILAFDLIGYLDVMTRVLASNNIAVLAFSAFSRDHIFVRLSDFDRAWAALNATILYHKDNDSSRSSQMCPE